MFWASITPFKAVPHPYFGLQAGPTVSSPAGSWPPQTANTAYASRPGPEYNWKTTSFNPPANRCPCASIFIDHHQLQVWNRSLKLNTSLSRLDLISDNLKRNLDQPRFFAHVNGQWFDESRQPDDQDRKQIALLLDIQFEAL